MSSLRNSPLPEVHQPNDELGPYCLIPLAPSGHAKVSPEDYAAVAGLRWIASRRGVSEDVYYAKVVTHANGKVQNVYMHRFLLNPPEGGEVDHRNRDCLDNRRANLRHATREQNACNMPAKRNNRTGFKGIWFDAPRGKYRAEVQSEGRRIRLGQFATAEEAARAYDAAALRFHGEFAWLNFPDDNKEGAK